MVNLITHTTLTFLFIVIIIILHDILQRYLLEGQVEGRPEEGCQECNINLCKGPTLEKNKEYTKDGKDRGRDQQRQSSRDTVLFAYQLCWSCHPVFFLFPSPLFSF